MTKEVTVPPVENTGVAPSYLQGKSGQTLIGIDSSDLIIPRIKLLQGISPELAEHNNAKSGIFWHNILAQPIGDKPELSFIVASFAKKYLLMAPRTDSRTILARAEDGVHWSPPNASFEVKLKGIKEPQKWETKPTVRESGLAEFGSSVAGDPDSKPAAILVYEYLIYLPDYPELSPIVMSLVRSQVRKGKDLNSKITFRNAPLASMRFKMKVIEEQSPDGPYNNFQFMNDGWATEVEYERVLDIEKRFRSYRVADEAGVVEDNDDDAPTPKEY